MLELKKIAFVKETHLDCTVIDKFFDCFRTKRTNPVNTINGLQCIDLLLRQHPTITDQNKLLNAEFTPDLLDLGQQRLRVTRVAFKNGHRYGNAVTIGEQARN